MSEAPELYWATQDGSLWRVSQFSDSDIPLVRADRYDEAIRQRDEAHDLLRRLDKVHIWRDSVFQEEVEAMLGITDAACSPPLAPGDVKTGKVV